MKRMVSSAALAATLAATAAAAQDGKTPQAADAFVASAEPAFNKAVIEAAQADWVYQTYITQDTEALTARAETALNQLMVANALEAAKHAQTPGLSYDTNRKLNRMRTAIVMPVPTRPGAAAEASTIKARIQGLYGKGQGTLNGKPINGSDIEAAMGTNRNPAELKEMWTSWHDNVGKPMKGDYAKLVELTNQGAKELGYADAGALWRSNYDMSPEDFAALTERLWNEVKPLYEALHCYTRTKLNEKYGDAVQARTGPIRADLLGNMWAQEWGNIYDVVAPPGSGDIGFDTTELLTSKGYDPLKMVKAGEGFFGSLGFAALPKTFWEAQVPSADKDTGLLLRQAMDKVAFLPFGLLIDRWRWQVFSGQIAPENYEKAWNDMRLQYQGIAPPSERPADAFDPGAKYHIPAVVPYTRYFLARVLQFQFYEAACKQSGWKGPLHRCSFYGDKRVGDRLNAMLELGASKPWPDALQAFTGSREISGKPMIRYFAPLMKWLAEQNKGRTCGW